MFQASDLGRTRSRELGVEKPKIAGVIQFYLFGNLYQTTNVGGETLQGREVTVDATHPWFVLFDRTENRKFFKAIVGNVLFRHILKTGGAFTSTKRWFSGGKKVYLNTGGSNRTVYTGYVLPCAPSTVAAAPSPTSDAVLMDLGAKQILYNLPGQPLADIGQTIGELRREGLPRTRSLASFKSGYSPRKGGQDYLTWQFGFQPVIQDIYALARSIDTADKQWRAYLRGAGKLQRRRFDFPPETSTTITDVAVGGTIYPQLPGALASNQSSTLKRTRTVVVKRRFVAAYVYTAPAGSESTVKAARKVLQYQKQYGLEIDPSLLWNLTPWSWLTDWFLPIGNFIDSASNLILGNTAMPWAYISEHSHVIDVYERPLARLSDGSDVGVLQVVSDYKRRIPASPFGFGLSWSDLSPWQLSILAALGVSR